MSLADADLLPFDEPAARPGRSSRPLRALDAPPAKRRKPRLAYAIVAVAGAGLIAAAQLGLSILTTQSSYDLAAVQSDQKQLTLDKQELSDGLAGLSSPQYLAANATALGMVIDETPSYLRLSDGAVTGSGAAAGDVSTVNVGAGNAAANELIANTPLVTDEQETISGDDGAADAVPDEIPAAPPIDSGLPSPSTH
ncbi:hypothetical protein [Microbacterium indicum]|uniref:hypothetical protein n=1 Tax=Microbacterium indicum TaxID=358100 RepID=UPI0003FB9572|nr:hypothetical protein [Microbacterium indicum]